MYVLGDACADARAIWTYVQHPKDRNFDDLSDETREAAHWLCLALDDEERRERAKEVS